MNIKPEGTEYKFSSDVAALQDAIDATTRKLEDARFAMGMALSRRIVTEKRAGERIDFERTQHAEKEQEFLRLQQELKALEAQLQELQNPSPVLEGGKSPDAAA